MALGTMRDSRTYPIMLLFEIVWKDFSKRNEKEGKGAPLLEELYSPTGL
jgi:hypothetical protein